jgi:serine kinase of HPr protein (carbohydrate metabolism regulator)
LPLHASTLVSPDRAYAIALAGHSGAGKSTTTYELIRHGWMMVSDDLTRVTIENGIPTAWPGRSKLRLLADACERFRIDVRTLPPAPNWPDKYLVEVPRWEQPVALSALVALARTDGALQVDVMDGAAAIRALAEQTYRLHYVAALGQTRRHLELVVATAAVTRVLRTRGRAPVGDVAAAVVNASVPSD